VNPTAVSSDVQSERARVKRERETKKGIEKGGGWVRRGERKGRELEIMEVGMSFKLRPLATL
jgi:hypothetical protein